MLHYFLLAATALSSAFGFKEPIPYPSGLPVVNLNFGESPIVRLKRDIVNRTLNDPNNCINNCVRDMKKKLDQVGSDATDGQEIAVMCRYPLENCYKACPDSQLRQLAINSVAITSTPCMMGDDNYNEFKKLVDCFNAASPAENAKCKQQCSESSGTSKLKGEVKMNLDIKGDPPLATISYDDDKKKNSENLKAVCQSMSCIFKCGESILREACGASASVNRRKFFSTIFSTTVKMLGDVNAIDGPVKECDQL